MSEPLRVFKKMTERVPPRCFKRDLAPGPFQLGSYLWPCRWGGRDGGVQDDHGAFELALRLTAGRGLHEHRAAELLEREWAEVERILRRPQEWRAVLAIAGRLLEWGEVSGHRCERLYRRFVW